jgi:uncharacterized protein (DUF433 family)
VKWLNPKPGIQDPDISTAVQRESCIQTLKPYAKGMETTAYRYLVKLPGVCGGHTIVADTRIGVHDVMGLILNGASLESVQRSLPDLTKAQIYECLAYYEDHRTEIDALVTEQMSETL